MARAPRFDRDALARAGLRVTRRDGWSAMTLGAVAAELGVTPMALYRLIANAEDLRAVVADSAAAAIQPTTTGEGIIASLHGWALHAHRHLVRLPGLTAYVMREWTELPSWLHIIEAFLDRAEREALSGDVAVHTVNAVFSYVLGRVQLQESITTHRRLGPVIASADEFPRIDANRREFRVARSAVAFRFGLDALTAGLRETGGQLGRPTP